MINLDDMQKMSNDNVEAAMKSFGAWSKAAQAIAVEFADYSKKSFEGGARALEKLVGAKSLDKVMEVQADYLKASYEDFVSEAAKLSELYIDLSKDAAKPFEGVLAKATPQS